MDIEFTARVVKEGKLYVAHTPELDLSSCGPTRRKAEVNLVTAVRLFLEEADRMGTLEQTLAECGYVRSRGRLIAPRTVRVFQSKVSLARAVDQTPV